MLLGGGGQGRDRVGHPRVGILPGHAELGGEVVRAEREHVNPGDRRDLARAGDAGRGLDQDLHDRRLIEGRVQGRRRGRPQAELGHRGELRPLPAGREPAGPGDGGGLGGGFDAGCDDALGAAVQERAERAVLAFPDPDEGEQAQIDRGRAQAGGDVQGHRRMLEVDHDRVVPGRLGDPDDIGRAAAADGEHQHRVGTAQPVQGTRSPGLPLRVGLAVEAGDNDGRRVGFHERDQLGARIVGDGPRQQLGGILHHHARSRVTRANQSSGPCTVEASRRRWRCRGRWPPCSAGGDGEARVAVRTCTAREFGRGPQAGPRACGSAGFQFARAWAARPPRLRPGRGAAGRRRAEGDEDSFGDQPALDTARTTPAMLCATPGSHRPSAGRPGPRRSPSPAPSRCRRRQAR